MKRLFCFFARLPAFGGALLIALAFTPAVSAAQSAKPDTVWLTAGGYTAAQIQAKVKPGMIVLALTMDNYYAKSMLFGDGVLFDGVTVITNNALAVKPGTKVRLNKSRFLYFKHPEAQKILADLGITKVPENIESRWHIKGILEPMDSDALFPGLFAAYDVKAGVQFTVSGGTVEADYPIAGWDDQDNIGIGRQIRTTGVIFKAKNSDVWVDILYGGDIYEDTGSYLSQSFGIGKRRDGKMPTGKLIFRGTHNLVFYEGEEFAQKAMQQGYLTVVSLTSTSSLASDFNGSGTVDFDDFFAFAAAFGLAATGDNKKFDLAPNGQIDFDDFFAFAADFGKTSGSTAAKPKPAIGLIGLNFPNPFNPATAIQYGLTADAPVSLRVYNILGQVVRTLVNERQAMGVYSIRWDGRDGSGRAVSSGIYIYRFDTGVLSNTRKVMLLK